MAMLQGDEEGILEQRRCQLLQPRASLSVHGLGGCRRARRIPPNYQLVARCEQWRSPLRQRGWATYARVDLVVQHSSHEQKRKETYKRPMCWPSSSTRSTMQPMMFSTTSGASTMMSLLVRRSKHGGGWRMGTTMRMMHELWVFITEFRRRYVM
jgi:hypothetical protein